MVFRNFEELHHVGGVVCSTEDEKLRNLFKLLNQEVQLRKEKAGKGRGKLLQLIFGSWTFGYTADRGIY